MLSFRTPFFCSVKVSVTKVAAKRSRANLQLYIAEAEQGSGAIGRWFSKVLAGTQQELETQYEAVRHRQSLGSVFELSCGIDLRHDRQGKGFDATRRSVLALPGAVQRCEANVQGALGV